MADVALREMDRRSADTLFAHALSLVDTLHPTVHDAAYVASGYLAFADTAGALRILGRYVPRADSHFQLHLHCDPGLDRLRAVPTFRALLVRTSIVCRT